MPWRLKFNYRTRVDFPRNLFQNATFGTPGFTKGSLEDLVDTTKPKNVRLRATHLSVIVAICTYARSVVDALFYANL